MPRQRGKDSLRDTGTTARAARSVGSSLGIINNLAMRFIFCMLVALAIELACLDAIYPQIVSATSRGVAEHVAVLLRAKNFNSNFDTLQIVRRYGLSWCYVTTGDGKIAGTSRLFAPALKS